MCVIIRFIVYPVPSTILKKRHDISRIATQKCGDNDIATQKCYDIVITTLLCGDIVIATLLKYSEFQSLLRRAICYVTQIGWKIPRAFKSFCSLKRSEVTAGDSNAAEYGAMIGIHHDKQTKLNMPELLIER